MAEATKKQKDRSPNFPFISLEMALERARQFWTKEKRGAAPFSVTAEHWRYSASSSGAMQTAAALKSYGLMADEPNGSGERQLRLTDSALRILLDTRPNSEERQTLLREASLSPAIARDIYERWGGDLPSASSLRHYLILERSFGESKADSVIKITKENYGFASISLSSSESGEEDEFGHPVSTGYELAVQGSSQPVARWGEPQPVEDGHSMPRPARQGVAAPSAPPARYGGGDPRPAPERLTFKGAEILIYFDGEPDLATLDFIERYIRLRKELLQSQTNGGA